MASFWGRIPAVRPATAGSRPGSGAGRFLSGQRRRVGITLEVTTFTICILLLVPLRRHRRLLMTPQAPAFQGPTSTSARSSPPATTFSASSRTTWRSSRQAMPFKPSARDLM